MKEGTPFFSVIIPTYNRSDFIGTSIQSVLDQTFTDFELIIVDDGSTDNTRDIVDSFKDPRITYHFKLNEERSIARNFGIEKACGRYINFLDSDDFFYPHHLHTAYHDLLERAFPELLHVNFEIRSLDGVTLVRKRDFDKHINKTLIYSNELQGNSFFIRADIIKAIAFIPDRNAIISEDWYLWLRLASRFPIHCVNKVTNAVREHDARSLRSVNPLKVELSLNLIIHELRKDEVFMAYYRSGFPYFLSECYSLISLYYIGTDNGKSLKYLYKSIWAYPLFPRRKRFWAIVKNLIRSKNNFNL